VQVDFVAGELIVETDDRDALDELLARWNGTIVTTISFADYGLEGTTVHLVKIDPRLADTSRLVADLKALNPEQTGALRVSSAEGLQTLAASASTALDDVAVGLNFVTRNEAYSDRVLQDGAGFDNAFLQKYLRGNCHPADTGPCRDADVGGAPTGVTEAWRMLDAASRLGNRVNVAVIDRGFSTAGTGLPPVQSLTPASLNQPNPVEATKPWHGTQVAQTLAAVPNDRIGVAGVAGPVANLIAFQHTDLVSAAQGILAAWQAGARIINMSFSARIPAVASTVAPALSVLNRVTEMVAARGVLLFASAGNDGADVDAEDCFIACWEEAWHTPCENDGVLCVGGIDENGRRDPSSNFGDEDVDLWAPFTVLVGPTPGSNFVYQVSGTSFSSPFAAGIAALVWAANPNASPVYVQSVLESLGNFNDPPLVRQTVEASRPVRNALGGSPPDVRARLVANDVPGTCGPQFVFEADVTDADGETPQVVWTSDVAGQIGKGARLQTTLPFGTHRVRATATDAKGFAMTSNEIVVNSVKYSLPPPTMSIHAPLNHQVFTTKQAVNLEVSGRDESSPDDLLNTANVTWYSGDPYYGGTRIAFGRRAEAWLPAGFHYVFAHYDPPCGGTRLEDMRLIEVVERADSPPTMVVSVPNSSEVSGYAENGQLCIRVSGFGWDEDDQDFVSYGWWETDRNDLQLKLLTWNQTDTVCLKAVTGRIATIHNIKLVGFDKTGNRGESPPIKVVVRGW
jgi:subtilisin family serine protease